MMKKYMIQLYMRQIRFKDTNIVQIKDGKSQTITKRENKWIQ
jgi:hypothetical protein